MTPAAAAAAAGRGSEDMEHRVLLAQAEAIDRWWSSPRWAGIKRDYSALEVAALRGTVAPSYPSSDAATKAFEMFKSLQGAGKATATFGALDPVQVVQMAKYLPVSSDPQTEAENRTLRSHLRTTLPR
jgi:isocitrate lyase